MKKFLLILALCVTGIVAANGDNTPETEPYMVNEGDTIYSIATRIATPKDNINKLAYEISHNNSISNGMIQPGQIIQIPVKREK